jgi:hypothetical protein
MRGFNGRDLASRVAGLLHGQFRGDIVTAACDLNVDPDELRRIVEAKTSTPDLEVLAKLVKRFGVDVCWLMTGEYDWRSHMSLLEDEEDHPRDSGKQLLLRLSERRGSASSPGYLRRTG